MNEDIMNEAKTKNKYTKKALSSVLNVLSNLLHLTQNIEAMYSIDPDTALKLAQASVEGLEAMIKRMEAGEGDN